MRVLLLGARGFIGSAVLRGLRGAGHTVVAVVRPARLPLPEEGVDWLAIELRLQRAQDWLPHLVGVDAVVNCAGAFQGSPRDSIRVANATGPLALYEACVASHVRRVVHFSAIGVDRATPSSFSASKAEGERLLQALPLDWVILRPSVVVGREAYGSGALLRGLAALPFAPAFEGLAPIQPVQLDDVVRTVVRMVQPDAPKEIALDLAGPQPRSLDAVVARYRQWLGWPPARPWRVPAWLASLAYRLGDVAGLFGWRPPIRSNARKEMVRGATGDPGPWTAATGIAPERLDHALHRHPATVQERWFARLYFVRPAIFAILALFWVGTGVVALGPGWPRGIHLLDGTFLESIAPVCVVIGSVADILIGIGIAFRATARPALWMSLAVSLFYAVAGTLLRPDLWSDPIGPMLKIWPVIVLILVALAVREDR